MKVKDIKKLKIKLEGLKHRHVELFSGSFKPKVKPANKPYKRKPRNQKGNFDDL